MNCTLKTFFSPFNLKQFYLLFCTIDLVVIVHNTFSGLVQVVHKISQIFPLIAMNSYFS